MSNGFQLDVYSLTFYGEKKAVKSIKLDDATTLVATLTFSASYDKKRNAWGTKFNVPNGKSHVALNLSSGIAIRVPTLPLLAVLAVG